MTEWTLCTADELLDWLKAYPRQLVEFGYADVGDHDRVSFHDGTLATPGTETDIVARYYLVGSSCVGHAHITIVPEAPR